MSFYDFLTALAWPRSSWVKKPIIAPPTRWGNFLNALTYPLTSAALDSEEKNILLHVSAKNLTIDELWTEVYRGKKHSDTIIYYLNQILAIDTGNTAALNKLGIVYAEKREFDKALGYFQKAINIDKNKAVYAHHNMGLAYYEMEDYANAAKALKKALSLESDLAIRHIAYAKVQEKLGNDKQLLKSLEEAVEVERNVETLFLLLKAYDNYGMKAEAAVIEKELLYMIAPFEKLRRSFRRSPKINTLYLDLAFC